MEPEFDHEMAHAPQSFLSWTFQSLGLFYLLLLLLAGLLCFLLTLTLVLRGRGSLTGVTVALIAHIPLLIGVFAALEGMLQSLRVIAMSVGAPRPADVAAGVGTALIAPMAGLLLMVPSYATAVIGGTLRSLFASPGSKQTPDE